MLRVRIAMSHVKRFLTRRAAVLPIVGLSLAFVTYVIRDGIKDKIKDEVDTANNATTVYLLRNDIEDARVDIAALAQQLGKSALAQTTSQKNDERAWIALMDATTRTGIQDQLSSISRLEELSIASGNSSAYRELIQLESELHDELTELSQITISTADDGKDFNQIEAKYLQYDQALFNSQFSIVPQFQRIENGIEASNKRRERVLVFWTHASWVVYLVGFILNILGLIYGVRTGTSAE